MWESTSQTKMTKIPHSQGGSVALVGRSFRCDAVGIKRRRSGPAVEPNRSALAGYRFPPDLILLAVRWYVRFGRSYRDLQELLAERGIEVDHVTLYRWVQRFPPPAGRRGPTVPAPGRQPLVGRRNLCERRRLSGATCTGPSMSVGR